MLIDLSWLKLHPKETEKFYIKQGPESFKTEDEDLDLIEPVVVELSVTNTGRLMVGQGKIQSAVRLNCARCLKDFLYKVDVPFTVEFCSEENKEYFKGEESFIYFKEPQVEIGPLVRENILLSLPMKALCFEDCKGLCPVCGVDLNQKQCECSQKDTDPRWNKLKELL